MKADFSLTLDARKVPASIDAELIPHIARLADIPEQDPKNRFRKKKNGLLRKIVSD